MKRMRPEHGTGPRGFSRWIRPTMEKYMMACCDCGLVHELQFHAVKVEARWKDGRWRGTILPRRSYQVMFRARRAARYTAKQRARRNAAGDKE